MKKKQIFIFGTLVFGCLLVGYLLYTFFYPSYKSVHIHAGFQVYVDGKKQDFSDEQYMSINPCKNDSGGSKKNKPRAEIQEEKAHLHDGVGDVAHSHVDGATWGDLFTNLNYKIDFSKGVLAYINGVEVKNILQEKLEEYQSVVILVGTHDAPKTYLENSVSKEKILETEKKSESCGSE